MNNIIDDSIIILIIYMGIYIWLWMLVKPLEETRADKVRFLAIPACIIIGSVVMERIAAWSINLGASFLIEVMNNSTVLAAAVVGFIYEVIMVMIRCLTVRLIARRLVNINMSTWLWGVNLVVVIFSVLFGIREFIYIQRVLSEISQSNYYDFLIISTTPNIYEILNSVLCFVVLITIGVDVLLKTSNMRRKAL